MQKKIRSVFIGVIAWLGLLLSGCGFINSSDTVEPSLSDITIPDKWMGEQANSTAVQPWLQDFNDPQLVELVTEAMQNNRDLHTAAARLIASAASVRNVSANLLPTVNADFSTDNNWRERSSSGNSSDSVQSSTHTLGLKMSWEADVWSKIADQSKAAESEYQANEAEYQAFRLSLVANVVKTWFRVLEASRLEQLAGEKFAIAKQIVQMVEESYASGLSHSSELHTVRGRMANGANVLAAAR
ncbi:MAG: TolC family protein, partial [Desulfobulbaceae bacterium]|nr:TolC family protein [Desulfobulbaceae bacterium]